MIVKPKTDIEKLWNSPVAIHARELNNKLLRKLRDVKTQKTDVHANGRGSRRDGLNR